MIYFVSTGECLGTFDFEDYFIGRKNLRKSYLPFSYPQAIKNNTLYCQWDNIYAFLLYLLLPNVTLILWLCIPTIFTTSKNVTLILIVAPGSFIQSDLLVACWSRMSSTLQNSWDRGQCQSRNSFLLPTAWNLLSPKAGHRACFML